MNDLINHFLSTRPIKGTETIIGENNEVRLRQLTLGEKDKLENTRACLSVLLGEDK